LFSPLLSLIQSLITSFYQIILQLSAGRTKSFCRVDGFQDECIIEVRSGRAAAGPEKIPGKG
jgi:hypothetical protein